MFNLFQPADQFGRTFLQSTRPNILISKGKISKNLFKKKGKRKFKLCNAHLATVPLGCEVVDGELVGAGGQPGEIPTDLHGVLGAVLDKLDRSRDVA